MEAPRAHNSERHGYHDNHDDVISVVANKDELRFVERHDQPLLRDKERTTAFSESDRHALAEESRYTTTIYLLYVFCFVCQIDLLIVVSPA